MRRDEVSGAPTLLYKVLVDRGVSWGQACELLSETAAAAKASAERAEVRSIAQQAVHVETAVTTCALCSSACCCTISCPPIFLASIAGLHKLQLL